MDDGFVAFACKLEHHPGLPMRPSISVLLPYRNARRTLAEACDSVLQDDAVTELVAIDDGSTDGSRDVIRAPCSRIVHVSTEGLGIVGALTRGLAVASGDFIARMDADDVSLPGRFTEERAWLARDPRLGAVGVQVEGFPAIGEGLRHYIAWQNALATPADHARDIFVESPLCHPATMMRRSALEDVGGYRDVPWPEDWDLWLRMHARGWHLAKIPAVLFRWRHAEGRLTFGDPRCGLDRLVLARAHYLAPRLARGNRRLVIWGAGPTGRHLARALESHQINAALFVDIDPRKIGGVARGVRIESPDALRNGDCILVAVGARGARDEIRSFLRARGWQDGTDFVCAA